MKSQAGGEAVAASWLDMRASPFVSYESRPKKTPLSSTATAYSKK